MAESSIVLHAPGPDDLMALSAYQKGKLSEPERLAIPHILKIRTVPFLLTFGRIRDGEEKEGSLEGEDGDDEAIDYFGPPRVEE